jgi:hypothetical protein
MESTSAIVISFFGYQMSLNKDLEEVTPGAKACSICLCVLSTKRELDEARGREKDNIIKWSMEVSWD